MYRLRYIYFYVPHLDRIHPTDSFVYSVLQNEHVDITNAMTLFELRYTIPSCCADVR